MNRKVFVILGFLLLSVLALSACAGQDGPAGPAGPAGPQGPQGETGSEGDAGALGEMTVADLGCTECHTDSSLITGKKTAWSESAHGSGEAYVRGSSSSCAGCHSGGGFSARIAAGLDPNEVEAGDPNPTRQDCRACHQIHTTYTIADFALETTDAVVLYESGETFDMGLGNLCANCHQPRRGFPDAVDGEVDVNSTHWGPHHGFEATMFLGIGGALVEGSPSAHYSVVTEGCPACHMGDEQNHTMEADVDRCQACHADLEDFDRNGVQTEIKAMFAEVGELLMAKGMIDEEGHPVVGIYPESEAAALWNYIVFEEDTSWGVHNSQYARALLEQALEALE